MDNLPTVELVEGAYYWVKHRHKDPDLWVVARWQHGCFWAETGNECSPSIISGPIPRPVQSSTEPADGQGTLVAPRKLGLNP